MKTKISELDKRIEEVLKEYQLEIIDNLWEPIATKSIADRKATEKTKQKIKQVFLDWVKGET